MAQWLPWRKKDQTSSAPEPSEVKSQGPARVETVSSVSESALSKSSLLAPPERRTLWRRGLARLRRVFTTPLEQLFHGRPLSEEVFVELEEVLLGADVGVQVTTALIARLQDRCRREKPDEAEVLRTYLKEELLTFLQKLPNPPLVGEARPWIILMVGVNGVGKTTTIAKLAGRFSREQKKVLLVAADTFRAAAIEQLEVWAERLGVDLIKHQSGASPAAVAFDGVRAAIARNSDVVIIDTAGRLHTKNPLMEELKKVHRVIAKELSGAPHEVLLVLDASTGQNALSQAQTFQKALPLTGVVLAKMDGSAKGGVALAVADRLGVPIRCIGLGEREEDLQDFSPTEFVEALFSLSGSESLT